jgi:lipopolysaccharide/colanic/teichoic acid biosynthesis glycosyltransferase
VTEDTLVRGYRELARDAPARPRDILLRALDIALSAVFVVLTAPLAAVIALVLVTTSGRPVLYHGERVGRGGRVFTMLKFRTLKPDAESRLGPYLGEELVRRTEEEFAPLGKRLKATQLDEIPQFWNVLKGDMSLVGPRPIRPRFFEELAHDLPAYWQRLVVRPGLTGLAQVRRGYETSMAEKLAHDLEWIADRSVRLYLRTVIATGWRVVKQSLKGFASRSA